VCGREGGGVAHVLSPALNPERDVLGVGAARYSGGEGAFGGPAIPDAYDHSIKLGGRVATVDVKISVYGDATAIVVSRHRQ